MLRCHHAMPFPTSAKEGEIWASQLFPDSRLSLQGELSRG